MKQALSDNWFLICSKDINDYGETISAPGYVHDK